MNLKEEGITARHEHARGLGIFPWNPFVLCGSLSAMEDGKGSLRGPKCTAGRAVPCQAVPRRALVPRRAGLTACAIRRRGHAAAIRAVRLLRRIGDTVRDMRSSGRGCAQVDYEPDFRQDIAATWPASIDDGRARADWAWRPRFDLDAMTDDMLAALLRKFQATIPEPGGCIVRPEAGPKALAAA